MSPSTSPSTSTLIASSSTPAATATAVPPLIKGYLPVRLRIPATTTTAISAAAAATTTKEEENGFKETTYFYVREHRGSSGSSGDTPTKGVDGYNNNNKKKVGNHSSTSSTASSTTLFVANAPCIPNVSTKLLLESLLGRFTSNSNSIQRVTVVPNPRSNSSNTTTATTNHLITIDETQLLQLHHLHPSYLPPSVSSSSQQQRQQQHGKYAHVVFATPKDMKRCKRALENIMMMSSKNSTASCCLELDALEIQTLADTTSRLQKERQRQQILRSAENENDSEEGDNPTVSTTTTTTTTPSSSSSSMGVLAVAQRYRNSLVSRERLLQECNAVMADYEQQEAARKRAFDASKSEQLDDDGFVTVTYNDKAVGSKVELEEQQQAHGSLRRKSGQKRNRRQQSTATGDNKGALPDFYRFQRKANQKKTMDELRQQFQDDLRRVKRLKEEKHGQYYKPF